MIDAESVRLRPMREGDVPAVAAIERRCHPRPWPRGLFRRLLRARTDARVAEYQGRVVAYTVADLSGRWPRLLNLCVDPRWRRRRIARRLVLDLLARARRTGAKGLWLEARPAAKPALRFYRRLGFRCAGRRRRYYRESRGIMDALVMTRLLR